MQSRFDGVSRMYFDSAGTRASSVESVFFACSAGRIRFHCAKKGSRDTTRSFTTGRFGSGATLTVAEPSSSGRVLQASLGTPLMDMAQVPHIPTRQAQRNESDGSVLR